MFILFQKHDARALGDDETSAVLVERQGGIFRVFRLRESLAVGKTTNGDRVNTSFRTTSDDGIGIAVLDGTIGLTNAVGTRGACRHNRNARSLGVVANGDATRCLIANHGRDHQRRNPTCTFFIIGLDALHNGVEAADARTDIHAQTIGAHLHVLIVLHGLVSSGQGVDRKTVVTLDEALVDATSLRIEVLQLGSDLHRKVGGIKRFDEVDAAIALHQVIPYRRQVVANRRNGAHAGDYYSSIFHISFVLLFIKPWSESFSLLRHGGGTSAIS